MLRTHTCGQLNQGDLNKEVILCGWAASRRDHGKIIFIDLRDRYGITQIVFLPSSGKETYEQAKKIKNEDVLKVNGVINLRPKGTENPKLPTGLIEIFAKGLEILNSCEELPFPIEDNTDAGEDIRLNYRYLDLRRRKILDNLILRHRFNQAFRNFLNSKGFLDVETPCLSKSTPEGARDFLVPARLQPNKFYALPQSPQLFKQILMVAGIDRYYQIVRCFRDEDLRKDRQPEFTQLDLEMSFVNQEDILSLVEEMICCVFRDILGKEIKKPFRRITYNEAIEKYGTDKPDIEAPDMKDYRLLWVLDFPLFEYNDEEKRWQACHHPFTSPCENDIPFLNQINPQSVNAADLSKVVAQSYDLVLNGEEIASGSIRIHNPTLQQTIFQILGITPEEAENKFGFLLKAFKYGAPPHGGIALGLDRFYAIISGSESIREVIAFPKTQRGICPLSNAPSSVGAKQLEEINIKLIEQEE